MGRFSIFLNNWLKRRSTFCFRQFVILSIQEEYGFFFFIRIRRFQYGVFFCIFVMRCFVILVFRVSVFFFERERRSQIDSSRISEDRGYQNFVSLWGFGRFRYGSFVVRRFGFGVQVRCLVGNVQFMDVLLRVIGVCFRFVRVEFFFFRLVE